jgi:DNA-binding response OmpR family regulator
MNRKALIVTNDDEAMDVIDDTLDSLGHCFDRARSKQQAARLATADTYDYILIDIELPAKRQDAKPDRVHGYHLLEELHQQKVCDSTLVIIMDGQAQCLDYVVDYTKKGAAAFAGKSPTDSHRLAKVIRRVLKSGRPRQRTGRQSRPFRGGPLTLSPDRAELFGVQIMTDLGYGHSLRILRALAGRNRDRYIPRGLSELMEMTGIDSQNTVTGCIRKLRQNCSERLARELNLEYGHDGLIVRNDQGYQLASWIDIEFDESSAADVTADVTVLSLNKRQTWALQEIEKGRRLQRCMIEFEFDVSDRTAKRDLLELRQRGLIVWVRDGGNGFYQLAESSERVA